MFQGTLKRNDTFIPIALKTANPDCPKAGLKCLLSEIKILSYLGAHPHIVRMIGAHTAELGKGLVYIALELCVSGSLQKHLRKLGPEHQSLYTELTSVSE